MGFELALRVSEHLKFPCSLPGHDKIGPSSADMQNVAKSFFQDWQKRIIDCC